MTPSLNSKQYFFHFHPVLSILQKKNTGQWSHQIANIHWIMEKAREFQKNSYFCFIDYAKFFDCVDHKLENSERDGNTRPPDLPLEKHICKSGKKLLEPDVEQQTCSKEEKEYIKAVYCHPAYLTYMQSSL